MDNKPLLQERPPAYSPAAQGAGYDYGQSNYGAIPAPQPGFQPPPPYPYPGAAAAAGGSEAAGEGWPPARGGSGVGGRRGLPGVWRRAPEGAPRSPALGRGAALERLPQPLPPSSSSSFSPPGTGAGAALAVPRGPQAGRGLWRRAVACVAEGLPGESGGNS